jgi:hypothetical protein
MQRLLFCPGAPVIALGNIETEMSDEVATGGGEVWVPCIFDTLLWLFSLLLGALCPAASAPPTDGNVVPTELAVLGLFVDSPEKLDVLGASFVGLGFITISRSLNTSST